MPGIFIRYLVFLDPKCDDNTPAQPIEGQRDGKGGRGKDPSSSLLSSSLLKEVRN